MKAQLAISEAEYNKMGTSTSHLAVMIGQRLHDDPYIQDLNLETIDVEILVGKTDSVIYNIGKRADDE